MKRIAIILAIMLVLGTVFISGCTTTQSNNTGNNTGQKNTSGIPGYSVGQAINIESGNNAVNIQSDNKISP